MSLTTIIMSKNKSETKSAATSPNSTISATPQMMILGMNSNDETTEIVRESPSSISPKPRSNSWFSRFFVGSTKEEVEEQQGSNHGYSAMGDESQRRGETSTTSRIIDPLQRLSPNATADLQYAALGEDKTTESLDNDGFFFRSTDAMKGGSAAWKTIRRNNRHGEVFEYSDALETIPAPVLHRYRTRYAQLNQDILLRDDGENEDVDFPDDLQLTNNDDIASFSTIPQSSLVYEADGKRLMRLPRDRVRLLMDPELEPGILSMEQGTEEEAYVLTVDDDLYRKIVMEMSPRYFQETKLDIRFAFIVLVIILLILFVNTVAFHEF